MNCRSCNNEIVEFFSLGKMPLVNSFLGASDIASEEKFDLSIGFCEQCYLVQLINTVDPDRLFRDYVYFSSTSKSFLDHCQKTANNLTEKLKLTKDSLVVELASNDGAQLQYFQDLGIKVLGIDPAKNIAEVANEKRIPTLPEFFNAKFAANLKEEKKVEADLIFGANVLAHVPEIIDFVKGVQILLKDRGTVVFEFPYLKGLLEKKFDTIYHEHVFYYSLIALRKLFQQVGLEIYDVEQTPMQGGSLRIFVSQIGSYEVSGNVKNLVDLEIATSYDKLATYQEMSSNVAALKLELINLLDRLKSEGKTIAAYSAPAKGVILMNYFGLDERYLDFIVDKASSKQGLYTPGNHLLVYPVEKIAEKKPDYLLVLCWNLADEIVEQLKGYHKAGGRLIIPVPEIKVV